MNGVSDEKIAAIRDGRIEGLAVNDELYAGFRRYFSGEQLIELAATAAAGKTFVRDTTVCSMSEAMGYIAKDCGSKSGRPVVQEFH
jgi:hypothetical protein